MGTENKSPASSALDFEALVEEHYRRLYQFAYNLSHDEAQAYDLTQETFLKWARKGHQLRDPSKVKTWLFTTLHREFLQARRRTTRFPHLELDEVAHDLPTIPPTMVDQLDAATVLAALAQIMRRFARRWRCFISKITHTRRSRTFSTCRSAPCSRALPAARVNFTSY